jgi:hypothetical protein
MITPSEEDFIKNRAYIPEHMPGYGVAISGGEPFLLENYLCYQFQDAIIFVGYPLTGTFEENKMEEILQVAIKRFNPVRVALMAQAISRQSGNQNPSDVYYQLNLANFRMQAKLKNMIKRASRELTLEKSREFKNDHRQLIADFLASRQVDEGTRYIFARIPRYLSSVQSAWIFSARDHAGKLAAFDIAELGAKNYAFYMFNFRSRQLQVPGASDLLLHTLIQEARQQGKSIINLGLGINAGVTFFKKKWGGLPFLKHEFILFRPTRASIREFLLQEFFRS